MSLYFLELIELIFQIPCLGHGEFTRGTQTSGAKSLNKRSATIFPDFEVVAYACTYPVKLSPGYTRNPPCTCLSEGSQWILT